MHIRPTQRTAVWVKGYEGSGIRFSARRGSFVIIPDSPSLDIIEEITIDAWINPSDISAWDRIVAKPHIAQVSPFNMYALTYDDAAHARFEGCINGRFFFIDGTSYIPIDVWTHVAATFDGYRVKIYINGNLENQSYLPGALGYNDMPLYIGSNIFLESENYFGKVDEVEIYNRALTEKEISDIYNRGKCKLLDIIRE